MALAAVFGAIGFLSLALPAMARDFVTGVCCAGSVYPLAALTAKRLRDRGKGTEYLWVILGVPVAASLYGLFMRPAGNDQIAIVLSAIYVLTMCWASVELGLMPGKSDTHNAATLRRSSTAAQRETPRNGFGQAGG